MYFPVAFLRRQPRPILLCHSITLHVCAEPMELLYCFDSTDLIAADVALHGLGLPLLTLGFTLMILSWEVDSFVPPSSTLGTSLPLTVLSPNQPPSILLQIWYSNSGQKSMAQLSFLTCIGPAKDYGSLFLSHSREVL